MCKLLYIPIGVPTFELVSARKLFNDSVKLLNSLCDEVIYPDDILLSVEDMENFISKKTADLIVIQNSTFANSAYTEKIIQLFNAPISLWTLREPVIDGGRLRLNSLTGAFSSANKMMMNGIRFSYCFGSPNEVKKDIECFIKAGKCCNALKKLHICQIGETPQGFDFGKGDADELLQSFGARYSFVKAEQLMETANNISEKDARPYLDKAKSRMVGLDETDEHTLAFAKLYKAYSDYVNDNKITAVASRCWPDFFTKYGTPVCAVLAMLGDDSIPASCEGDVLGAISMFIGQKMSGMPCFFGDPVSLDEGENTLTFWHCGTAACSLARKDTGAQTGVHCNRKIGPTLEFGCKPCEKVTIFRIGRTKNGLRFFAATGEALDKPKQFSGTSIVVKTDTDVKSLVKYLVADGWEPHYAVIFGDYSHEIRCLANMEGIEVKEYK